MKKRLLIQTQLSNYNTNGKFILECDSGWQMVMGRVREMLKINEELSIDIMGPEYDNRSNFSTKFENQVVTPPWKINPDLFENPRLDYIQHQIVPNALATRYDFNYTELSKILFRTVPNITNNKVHFRTGNYDAVYINDPMHLRNFKAMFKLNVDYMPKFYVHSHFIDDPSAPKFPTEASLWLGQCEAAIKADYNFWQCQTSLDIFEKEMRKLYLPSVVNDVMSKSVPWDDGYSSQEITSKINEENIRFDTKVLLEQFRDKVIIFVPNRIGGGGRSSDYTNCGKFMFDLLPELKKIRNDYLVIAGNPSQKFSNDELVEKCGDNGYMKIVPDSLNRDEFKWIASHSHIVVGLYDQDSYGGTASRECIELGCVPLWLNVYEFKVIASQATWPFLINPDFSNFLTVISSLIEFCKNNLQQNWLPKLQQVVRDRCSYESTTYKAMQIMNLI